MAVGSSVSRKEQAITALTDYLRTHRHERITLEQMLRRPEVGWEGLYEVDLGLREVSRNASADAIEQVVLETKYAGYVERQAAAVERFQRLESKAIPAHFDYAAVPQLRAEAKEKLSRVRPASLGQASRISGITPADLAVVMFYLG